MVRWFYSALLLLVAFVAVQTQNSPTVITLTGTVLDQDGALLWAAQVTLKRVEPAHSVSTTTDIAGAFHFEKLQLGIYQKRG